MTNEQTFFTGVLADHLNKRKTASADGLNWNLLLSYAKSHQVEAILYYQCKDFLPPEIRSRLTQLYASTLFYYTNRTKQFEEISKALAEREVPFYTVKGLEVAALYPISALRTMGDCDIIVHPEDKSKAHQIMLSLGYENRSKQDAEWIYYKNRMEFELHDHLLYGEAVNTQASIKFAEMAWDYAKPDGQESQCILDWNFHIVFLLLHLKKHFLNSGVGFRQFMDLAVVVQNQELNWTWIEDTLVELELLEFAKACFSFCERWFETEMPYTTALDDAFFEESTEKVFQNGVFGFGDEKNGKNRVINLFRNENPLKSIFQISFPTYNNVRYVPYYSFVEGKPWLLPAVWIYRLVRILIRRKGTVKLFYQSVRAEGDYAAQDEALKKWGV